MLLPGGLVIYFGFESGGFFPGSQSAVAVVLALLSAANIALDRRSVLRRNRPLLVVTLLFAAYAAWVLVSAAWSHAPLRAVSELNLTLVYLLAVVLYGSSVTSRRRMRWLVRGLALGAFVVCLAGLLSRTLPHVWPIAADLDTQRLSYPVTYWNALGLLAALGIILCVGLASDDHEPELLKGLSALAVPIFAATLLLTFSRGAIAAGIAGAVLYILLARSRSLLSALVSVVPTSVVALHATYEATALAQRTFENPAAIAAGRHVAVVVGVCSLAAGCVRWLLVAVDRRLIAISWRVPLSRRAVRLSWVAAVILACALASAAGLPHAVKREYDGFVSGEVLPGVPNVRDRLTQAGADGRLTLWRIGIKEFDAAPLHGAGAGTFELAWQAHRPADDQVVNAHSLYVENLANLGIVGLILLAAVLVVALAATARRVRGADRALYATALAAMLTWAIRAGFDWDWQMPVVSLPVFVLAGAGLAQLGAAKERSSDRRAQSWASRFGARRLAAVAALGLGLVPALMAISESHLKASARAFDANDCAKATSEARASLTVLPFRPDAHEIIAYCELAAGDGAAALRDITTAVGEDPNSWETHEGLSVVEASTGRDPRAEMARAVALNPRNVVTAAYAGYFSYGLRRYWAQEAAFDLLQVSGQNDYRNLSELRGPGLHDRSGG